MRKRRKPKEDKGQLGKTRNLRQSGHWKRHPKSEKTTAYRIGSWDEPCVKEILRCVIGFVLFRHVASRLLCHHLEAKSSWISLNCLFFVFNWNYSEEDSYDWLLLLQVFVWPSQIGKTGDFPIISSSEAFVEPADGDNPSNPQGKGAVSGSNCLLLR
ncbi:hypothetical protein L1049_017994 [Liquidambar formosana]|uniref:Uncharacterized protein n=1 Tax=Liquidambar formosana TaxID=63359 RepID=A0AAP0NKB3_LIQFO